MKTRLGFVSNSSSTSFVIHNMSNEKLTLVDFVESIGRERLAEYLEDFEVGDITYFTIEIMLEEAKKRYEKNPTKYTANPSDKVFWVFGDEQASTLGRVFDYMLRDDGEVDKDNLWFRWYVDEYLR